MAEIPASFERQGSFKTKSGKTVGESPDSPTSSRVRVTRTHRSDPAKTTENTVKHTTAVGGA